MDKILNRKNTNMIVLENILLPYNGNHLEFQPILHLGWGFYQQILLILQIIHFMIILRLLSIIKEVNLKLIMVRWNLIWIGLINS